jgi:putative ABC transport system substrate-binding protein
VAALLTLEDPLLLGAKRQIADLAAKVRLPTIYGNRDFAEARELISCGVDRRQMNRRAAEHVDKILKGTRPADLPVEQPTKFELVINLKTAKRVFSGDVQFMPVACERPSRGSWHSRQNTSRS